MKIPVEKKNGLDVFQKDIIIFKNRCTKLNIKEDK